MATHEVLDRRVYAVGEVIFKEGDIGRRCAYLVQEGKVEISKNGPTGPTVLGHIGAGAIFGEMALIDNKPRMAMARAVEMTTVVIVTEAVFEEKMRKADPFIRGLLNLFVRTIRDVTDKMVGTGS